MNHILRGLTGAMLSIALLSSVLFADVPIDIQRHWAGEEINTLILKSILTGYPDGRFRPNALISRQEMASVIAKTIRKEREHSSSYLERTDAFSDLENAWAAKEIQSLVSEGILHPDEGEMFRPFDKASREEAASMIYRAISKLEAKNSERFEQVRDERALPSDISMSPYCDEIEALYRRGILKGTPEGFFYPKDPVKRSEFAAMLRRAMGFQTVPMEKTLPSVHTISVPYLSQLWPVSAPVGCEGASLLMGLKAKGYAADLGLKEFLDAMPKSASDPSKGFVGSPYVPDLKKRTRTTIFPGKLREFGSQYGKVLDFSGADLHQIQSEVLAGNPVVVYMTMHYEKPFYRFYDVEGEQKYFLSNNHVVLLAGYDAVENKYFIVDPYNEAKPKEPYSYWLPGELFEKIYKERHHALVIE